MPGRKCIISRDLRIRKADEKDWWIDGLVDWRIGGLVDWWIGGLMD